MTLIFDFVSFEFVTEKHRVTIPTPRICIDVLSESSIFRYVLEVGVVIKEDDEVCVVVGVVVDEEIDILGEMIDVG